MSETTPVNLDDYADALLDASSHVEQAITRLMQLSGDAWVDRMADQLNERANDLFKRYEAVCNGDIVQAESGGEG